MWNNQKQQKLLSLMSNLHAYYQFKLDFRVPTYRGQVVNQRHQTPQGQSVANLELPCRLSL